MKAFLILYGEKALHVTDFDKAKIVLTNNGITDFFDGAIYTWQLYVYDKSGYRYFIDEAYEAYTEDELNECCRRINEAFKNGESEVHLEKIHN